MGQLTFLSAEPPVSRSASPEAARDWMTTAASWRSNISSWLIANGPDGWSGRTCPAFSPSTRAKPSAASSADLFGGTSPSPPADGKTPASASPLLSMAPTEWRGECLTLNTSEHASSLGPSRNGDVVCSLSDILETGDLPPRYYLSAKACAGILRRAEKRGKTIPEPLRSALLAASGGGLTDVSTTLVAAGQKLDWAVETFVAEPVAFSCKDHGADATEGVAPTLRAMGHDGSHANAGGQLAVAIGFNARQNPDAWVERSGPLDTDGGTQAVAFQLRGRDGGAQAEVEPGGVSPALRAADGGSTRPFVATDYRVRRLTPRECERLQCFRDDYTLIPGATSGGWRDLDDGEDADALRAEGFPVKWHKGRQVWRVQDPDGPRYKALGNSMAVNAMQYLGERIAAVDAIVCGPREEE